MKLESFYQFIAPEVIGCPEPVMDRACIEATRDFCARTYTWRTTGSQPLIKGTVEYEIDIPNKTDVVRVLRVEANGASLQSLGDHFNHNPFSDGWGRTHSTYTYTLPKSITLTDVPVEKIKDGLVIEAALKPQFNVTTVDDDMFNRYYEVIVMKAKQILFLQPGTSWNHQELAAFYFTMYQKEVAKAAAEARRGYAFLDVANPEIQPVW